MNTVKAIDVDYLTNSKTIETITVENENLHKIFFIYNYQGVSFRLFKNHSDLLNFFLNKNENFLLFNTEKELDYFLSKVKL